MGTTVKRIEIGELEYEDYLRSEIKVYRGLGFTGFAYSLSDTGYVTEEMQYREGSMDGISRSWYESGPYESEAQVRSGHSHGDQWEWRENGMLKLWRNVILSHTLEEKIWDERGQLVQHCSVESGTIRPLLTAEQVARLLAELPLPPPLRPAPHDDQRLYPTPPPPLGAIRQGKDRFDFTAGLELERGICAESLQQALSKHVVCHDDLPAHVRTVAGVDVAYENDGNAYQREGNRYFAAVVVHDALTLEIIETQTATGYAECPYIPGYFAFRELPCFEEAFANLCAKPDLVVCDGQGIAHQHRCGLASHFGLVYGVPTIGCGKTHLIGEFDTPGKNRGDISEIIDHGEVIGRVVRTQNNVQPLFVSIGHRISLQTATDWILRVTPDFRQPTPIRSANQAAADLRNRICGHSASDSESDSGPEHGS